MKMLTAQESEGGGASATERTAAEFTGAVPTADGSLDADAGQTTVDSFLDLVTIFSVQMGFMILIMNMA